MLDKTSDIAIAAESWLAEFEAALQDFGAPAQNAVVVTQFTISDTLPDGTLYQNQGVQVARIRWGLVVEDHLIEDTQLLTTIHLVQERLNPSLRVAGMAMTMFDSRTHLSLQVVEEVAKHFPELIFHAVIPRSVRIAEAPSYGEPLVSFDAKSRGAQAYEALTRELLEREAKQNQSTCPKF